MNAFPVLETARLSLREIVEDDAPDIFNGLSHPDIIRYYGVQYDTLEATQVQMKWFEQLRTEGTGIWWAITHRDEKYFMGATGFNNLHADTQRIEIGFWLLTPYWGNGYITEALNAIIPYAFNALRVQRIEALVETENQNSISVLKKVQFIHESTDVDCEIKNGKTVSLLKYVLTNKLTPLD